MLRSSEDHAPSQLERTFAAATSPADFARGYLEYIADLLAKVDEQELARVIEALLRARAEDRSIFIMGNGGSAATASHFANDLAVGVQPPLRAVSLTDNTALLSAVANDFGYSAVFVKQLESSLRSGDVVVAISASGNSANVIEAVRYANRHDALTIGFTGGDGGLLRGLVQLGVHVPAERGECSPVEDVHMVFEHILTNYMRLWIGRAPAR